MVLEHAVVLITGGASGLGAAVVHAVTKRNGRPVVLDRAEPDDGWDHELVDLADTRAAEAATTRLVERCGGVDAVVTCAGTDVPGPFTEVSGEVWDRIVSVNLLGTAAVLRAAIPHLPEGTGRIVTVASTLGHRVAGDATAYCASKFGVVGFTRALMAEVQDRFGVTLLTPGGMSTAFFDERDDRYKPAPGAPLCDAADVAEAVIHALEAPDGCLLRELVVTGPREVSWP